MYEYLIWARSNAYQKVNATGLAEIDLAAEQISVSRFGVGNVLNYTPERLIMNAQ